MTSGPSPFIIPVFIPHSGCPHQCAFCNQVAVTRKKGSSFQRESLHSRIDEFLGYSNTDGREVQIAFYGGNFLGLCFDTIMSCIEVAQEYIGIGVVDKIRFSTRPDTIDKKRLDLISQVPVGAVELGVQSMDDGVLVKSNRGHTSEDCRRASGLIRKYGYKLGLQMMVGLPGDTEETVLETGRRISELNPDFVRIYPAVVLEGSPLAEDYRAGLFYPFELDFCVSVVKKLFLYFTASRINIIRMGLQAEADFEDSSVIIAGPYHPSFGHLVFSEIFHDMAVSLIDSKKNSEEELRFFVHPSQISRLRGHKNMNIEKLIGSTGAKVIKVISDNSFEKDTIGFKGQTISLDEFCLKKRNKGAEI